MNIPHKAKFLLQLGQYFNVLNNVINKEKITVEFVKHIENNVIKLNDKTKTLLGKGSFLF